MGQKSNQEKQNFALAPSGTQAGSVAALSMLLFVKRTP
jgi:hypothetical protein